MYPDLRQKFSAGLSKLHRACAEHFGGNKIEKVQILVYFEIFLNLEKCSDFRRKAFVMDVKTAL